MDSAWRSGSGRHSLVLRDGNVQRGHDLRDELIRAMEDSNGRLRVVGRRLKVHEDECRIWQAFSVIAAGACKVGACESVSYGLRFDPSPRRAHGLR